MENKEANLAVPNSAFEEKVYIIADEVLSILRELSRENEDQISSELLAEKMVWRDSVNGILNPSYQDKKTVEVQEETILKEWAETLMNKLSEFLPSSMIDELSDLKAKFSVDSLLDSPKDWMDSPIGIIRKYNNSLKTRIEEHEEFIRQIVQYLSETERHLSVEMSSQQEKAKNDLQFGTNLSSQMDLIKEDLHAANDLETVKKLVFSKIESINNGIEEKRLKDMSRLKETEKTLNEMRGRLSEIKKDAEELRKKSHELELASVTDPLTGLYNIKAYNEKVKETLAHVQRYNIKASLIIFDIDNFKKINDISGHKVGDFALKKLALLLKKRLRSNDFISRVGGDEFTVILPHTDFGGAVNAGESLRTYVDNAMFTHKGQQIPLKISVGLSTFKAEDTGDTVFDRADKALYLAKKSGRNMVKTEEDLTLEKDVA